MDHVLGLKCVLCGEEYSAHEVLYVCPKHGYEGILDVQYDYELIGKRLTKEGLAQNPDYSIWRYKPLLPVDAESPIPPLQVGWTPLYQAQRLGEKLGLSNLYLKDEGRNPTASLKDRASAIGVVKAQELGKRIITCASTGNAASSLAGLAASAGMRNVIFVPESAPRAKVAQLLIFGAQVIMVKGTYDQAFDLCLEASDEFGWYSRNTAYNPYLSEGKKTAALEVCEQLGWQAPDRVFVSVGDGCIIGGLHKGFKDLLALGFIERTPKLVGVQAEGAAPLVRAWETGKFEPIIPRTLADSISVGVPRDRVKALRAVQETGGQYVAVSDEEILEAMRQLGREAAIFAEPAGAAGFAGLVKVADEIDPQELIVVLVTGNGLKDVESAIKATKEPPKIEPTMEDLQRLREESLQGILTARQ
ncbi:MAG: threonine synthase [Anaerolineae bacterium]